jgi:hypothetical protein
MPCIPKVLYGYERIAIATVCASLPNREAIMCTAFSTHASHSKRVLSKKKKWRRAHVCEVAPKERALGSTSQRIKRVLLMGKKKEVKFREA